MAEPVSVRHISTDSTQKVISHTATGNHVMNSQQCSRSFHWCIPLSQAEELRKTSQDDCLTLQLMDRPNCKLIKSWYDASHYEAVSNIMRYW